MRRISIQGSKFTGLDTQSDSTAIDVVIVECSGSITRILQRRLRP